MGKIEDADGYIIYGVQSHNHDDVRKYHKLKVIYNKNQGKMEISHRKYRYRWENYILAYLIRGFKKTKAGITIYTQYERVNS